MSDVEQSEVVGRSIQSRKSEESLTQSELEQVRIVENTLTYAVKCKEQRRILQTLGTITNSSIWLLFIFALLALAWYIIKPTDFQPRPFLLELLKIAFASTGFSILRHLKCINESIRKVK